MPAITPEFMFDLETNMRLITERSYDALTSELWWDRVAKRMPKSETKSERLVWLLDTAMIRESGKGGNITFTDIVTRTTEYEFKTANNGLKVEKSEFEDHDGSGIDMATHWSRTMGAYAAYWPQKQLAKAILENGTAYDGVTFFHTAHPLNPYKTSAGTYKNVFTGAASGAYPGAIDITESVTVEAAVNQLAKAIAYIATIKMPNGEDPRFLVPSVMVVPPALSTRATQITDAKFIAQAATGGAGSADVSAVIRKFGLGEPIVAPELGAGFGGSDTSFYLGMKQLTSDELGAFGYAPREEFTVKYYGPQTDAQLARAREFQWFTEGRNYMINGHPYLFYRCDKT